MRFALPEDQPRWQPSMGSRSTGGPPPHVALHKKAPRAPAYFGPQFSGQQRSFHSTDLCALGN
jgi:hypothetical protein